MINNASYTSDKSGRPTDTELMECPHLYSCNNVEFLNGPRDNTAMADYLNHSIVRISATENIAASTILSVTLKITTHLTSKFL